VCVRVACGECKIPRTWLARQHYFSHDTTTSRRSRLHPVHPRGPRSKSGSAKVESVEAVSPFGSKMTPVKKKTASLPFSLFWWHATLR